eukprot:Nitzschia sp. Nitz4//scaffold185_size43419//13953//14846//NITZ4_007299-RA/size43419-processed-gene-0.72-mRNA-1//1//CDS//3329539703//6019//frame0
MVCPIPSTRFGTSPTDNDNDNNNNNNNKDDSDPAHHISSNKMSLANAQSLLGTLQAQYEAGDAQGPQTLNQVKLALVEAGPSTSPEWTAVSCQALELGILLATEQGDMEGFARNVAQWKAARANAASAAATNSPRTCHVLGLNLMHLLVDHRLSEFHAELELLSDSEAADPYVTFPIELERQWMVGLYDQVLTAQVPHPSFQFFVDSLILTVRDGIADSLEVAYSKISLKDAALRMRYQSTAELQDYIQTQREDWLVQDGSLVFQPEQSATTAEDQVPSKQWIAQSLTYATEMERIV